MPSQKFGTDWPASATPLPTRSNHPPGLRRREHPDRDPDDDGEGEGGQPELERLRQRFADQVVDRRPVGERLAEVTLDEVAEVAAVLHDERLVEAEVLLDQLHRLGRRVRGRHQLGDVARCPAEHEHDRDDDPQHQDRLGQPDEGVPQQRPLLRLQPVDRRVRAALHGGPAGHVLAGDGQRRDDDEAVAPQLARSAASLSWAPSSVRLSLSVSWLIGVGEGVELGVADRRVGGDRREERQREARRLVVEVHRPADDPGAVQLLGPPGRQDRAGVGEVERGRRCRSRSTARRRSRPASGRRGSSTSRCTS